MRTGNSSVLVAKTWIFFVFLSILVPKSIFILFDLMAITPKLFKSNRLRFLSIIGGVFSMITFCLMWWGALVNRYNIEVKQFDIPIANLPISFDGYRIIQISDLHLGSYTDTCYISKLVSQVNQLRPNLIVFTGDIVNRRTNEIYPFISPLSKLKAEDGVLSVLGNHDYGDYYDWDSDSAKSSSFNELIKIQNQIFWQPLLNTHKFIHRGADSIAIIGVENIGDPPFKAYGDLKASYLTLSDGVVKILLSHNPVHWLKEVADKDSVNIALTLSGHTHAMQIELFGLSPAKYRYSNWGGLYSDKSTHHKLYVNIGIGTVALPMRLGATPEVTILTLKKL